MFRILALALLPLALFLAACGGGSSDDASRHGPQSDPPASVSDAASDAEAAGLPLTDDGTYQVVGDDAANDVVSAGNGADDASGDLALSDGADATADLFGAFNPLQFLGGMDTASLAAQDADPSLEAALLSTADLPGFQSFGDFAFSMPSAAGDIEMVARMFFDGDLIAGDFDTMVITAGMIMPPEIVAEMGDLEAFTGLTDADLAEIESLSSGLGVDFADISVLDASGLGDSGVGMHMELDFGALLAGFGPVEGDDTLPDGIAMDMYIFFSGDRALMTMVMWPTNVSPSVDARDLAEIMDGRA